MRRFLRRGTWRTTPWPGIHVDGAVEDGAAAVVRAASLWLGGDLVACHSTAALLWGFDVHADAPAPGRVLHFLGPPDLDNRRLRGLQVHPSSLGTDDAVLRRGVWCTPPARTACDVVRLGDPVDGLATLDAALRSGWCTREGLSQARARQRGLRGVVRLTGLVPLADAGAESPMESRMRWRLLVAGLPVPRVQVEIGDRGRRHRLDLGWEEHRVGAEFDGLEAHMTRSQLAADRDATTGPPSADGGCCTSRRSTSIGTTSAWSPRPGGTSSVPLAARSWRTGHQRGHGRRHGPKITAERWPG